MVAIDNFLMDRIFQSVSNFVQKTFGLTCFFLARVCTVLASNFYIYGHWKMGWYVFNLMLPLLIFSTLVSLYLLVILDFKIIRNAEEATGSSLKVGLGNPYRQGTYARLALLPVSVLLIAINMGERLKGTSISSIFIPVALTWTFWSLSAYFMCCTPIPPCESRVKKFIKSIGKLFSYEPSPEPAKATL